MTRHSTDVVAGDILARVLPLPLDEQKAVMDEVVAAVVVDRAHRMYPPLPALCR